MKHSFIMFFCAVFLCSLFLGSCKDSGQAASASTEANFDKDASYALGMNLGGSLRSDSIFPDMDEFFRGLTDSLNGKETRLTMDQAMAALNKAIDDRMAADNADAVQKEIDYLAENSKKEGVKITASGLQYEVLAEGAGSKPVASDTVRVNYEGTFTDGSVFDSSYSRGQPAEFALAGVIPGWTEGMQLMSEGAKYRFYVPSALGYGAAGIPQMIPPYATLVFEVELLSIVK